MTVSDMSGPEARTETTVALPDDRIARVSAVIVRVAAGLLFLDNLTWKVPPHFGADDGSGLYYFTTLAIDHPVVVPFTSIIENVVLPNFGFFGWGVFLVEICLAVFLLLGLATRFWAVVGIAQAVAIFLTVGAAPNEWKWSYFLMVTTLVAVLGFASGRVLGLDRIVRRRVTGSSLAARAYRAAS